MSIGVDDPGNHSCPIPALGQEAQSAFHAVLHWRCDECRAKWRKPPSSYEWEPLTDSSWRWKRAEARRLEARLEHR